MLSGCVDEVVYVCLSGLMPLCHIEAVLLAMRWLVVGEFMGRVTPGKRWIGGLGGRGGLNHHCPWVGTAVFDVLGSVRGCDY